jgi:hypothetical protein
MKRLYITVVITLSSMFAFGQGYSVNDSTTVSNRDINEMIATLDDVLDWMSFDTRNGGGDYGCVEDEWGSAYWLTTLRDELVEKMKK